MGWRLRFSPFTGQLEWMLVTSSTAPASPVTGNPIGLLLALTYT